MEEGGCLTHLLVKVESTEVSKVFSALFALSHAIFEIFNNNLQKFKVINLLVRTFIFG